MQQLPEDAELVAQIVQSWVTASMERPELTSHIWLRAIGIMTGLTLRMSGAEEDKAEGALKVISSMAMDVYRDSSALIERAPLQ